MDRMAALNPTRYRKNNMLMHSRNTVNIVILQPHNLSHIFCEELRKRLSHLKVIHINHISGDIEHKIYHTPGELIHCMIISDSHEKTFSLIRKALHYLTIFYKGCHGINSVIVPEKNDNGNPILFDMFTHVGMNYREFIDNDFNLQAKSTGPYFNIAKFLRNLPSEI